MNCTVSERVFKLDRTGRGPRSISVIIRMKTRHATFMQIYKYGATTSLISHCCNNMLSAHLQFIALTLALAPSLASAAIFPPNTQVKMLDAKGFKKAMKTNVCVFFRLSNFLRELDGLLSQETSMVAFVAPWCGVSSYSYNLVTYFDIVSALSTDGTGV